VKKRVRNLARCFTLVALCFALLPAAALAQYAFRFLVVRNFAPVRIDRANAYRQGGWHYECIGFTNISTKVVTSVRFHFIYIDATFERVGEDFFERKGSFDAGGAVEGVGVATNVPMPRYEQDLSSRPDCQSFRFPPQGISVNEVAVDRVEFADGTTWTAPTPRPSAPPSATPDASPVPSVTPP
jgi:hypothetical protein